MRHLLSFAPLLLVLACGGDSDGGRSNVDPRCALACAIVEPDLEGAFDVCSEASAEVCHASCEARIADVDTLCASCLLEDACFDPYECLGTTIDGGCDSEGCTISGREGSCSSPPGDDAAYRDCLREVYPRRDVSCSPEFRPVGECAEVCG